MDQDHTRDRPTGTVSFLFTDIEGSTPLWEQHPEAMRAALERHDAILRDAIDAHHGFVFSTAGDAFSAAFGRAGVAVEAALDAQRALQAEPWPDEVPVKVRMGVHTGEAQERDGDYFGSAVNRAARLMGIAHGGQVLVSLAVEELVRDDLSDGVGLKGLGEHALKGLSRPESVFQLTGPDLPDMFSALAAATAVPGNLPSPPTSFVGRDVEVAELVELVGAHRLVTLTGVGGVGKTRLAIEVAAELADDFGDGVWLIELAPVGDPAAVPDAVATSLGITAQPDLTVTASVARALSGRQLLIVLDNCEHVLDAAADLVETVLAGTDSLTVVATSREGLRVGAEQLWPVPSLDVGGGASAAVELFVERARSIPPSNSATPLSPQSSRSAGVWTGSRWASSWPRRAQCR